MRAPPGAQKEVNPIASIKEEYKRMSFIVPPDLHRVFKAACAAEGVEMSQVLLQAIELFVNTHKPAAVSKKRGRQ